jgi:hypothetical protein
MVTSLEHTQGAITYLHGVVVAVHVAPAAGEMGGRNLKFGRF